MTLTSDQVFSKLTDIFYAARRQPGAQECRWVMDRAWYDRMRAAALDDAQEAQGAAAHANAVIEASATFPRNCPVCTAGPLATMSDLAAHTAAAADPQNREPSEHDRLFGLPIDVRDDAGEPRIVTAEGPAS